jgi:hypothetical protein
VLPSELYKFSNTTHNFIRSLSIYHNAFSIVTSPFTLLCGNVFSLLRYRGNAIMQHHPIVAQQEAEVMLTCDNIKCYCFTSTVSSFASKQKSQCSQFLEWLKLRE